MAGTKLAYRNVNDTSSYQPLMRNMEENDVLSHLKNQSFDKKAEALEQLRTAARRNGGRLPFHNQRAVFQALSDALSDSNWDVRHQCIQLLHELIPSFGDDLDDCMSTVLEQLIPNIGDTKITVRRAVIQTIHVYMKYTNDIQGLFRAIVRFGLENRTSRIKKEMVISLPMVFTPEFSHENMFEITQALAKCLLDSDAESGNGLKNHALLSLQKIKKLVGDGKFNAYLQKLSAPLRRFYRECMENQEEFAENNNKPDSRQSEHSAYSSRSNGHIKAFEPFAEPPEPKPRSKQLMTHSTSDLEFGIVPGNIMDKLNDQSNFRARAAGVEELKLLIKDLNDISMLHPHILNFISFLNNLLDDSNFKITTVTLEILGLLVTKLSFNVQPHLKPLVLALCKRMGDNKIVVRQAIMKVAIQLMQILSPKDVLTVICENLTHRNSRVRQETLNIVIRSLLTFPSYEFDLGELCQKIAHTLIDPKRQVRQASLECFSVLAQAMGAGKLQPLVQAVDSVELSFDGDGVMAAVQSRLARRQLPRVNADGLIDYATPIPSSAASSRGSAPAGADIDWILMASGSAGSSARSARSDIELESIASGSARSTPVHIPESPVHTPRGSGRHLASASRRNKLPWADEDGDPNRSLSPASSLASSKQTSPRRSYLGNKVSPRRFIHPSKRSVSYRDRFKMSRMSADYSEKRKSILDMNFPRKTEEIVCLTDLTRQKKKIVREVQSIEITNFEGKAESYKAFAYEEKSNSTVPAIEIKDEMYETIEDRECGIEAVSEDIADDTGYQRYSPTFITEGSEEKYKYSNEDRIGTDDTPAKSGCSVENEPYEDAYNDYYFFDETKPGVLVSSPEIRLALKEPIKQVKFCEVIERDKSPPYVSTLTDTEGFNDEVVINSNTPVNFDTDLHTTTENTDLSFAYIDAVEMKTGYAEPGQTTLMNDLTSPEVYKKEDILKTDQLGLNVSSRTTPTMTSPRNMGTPSPVVKCDDMLETGRSSRDSSSRTTPTMSSPRSTKGTPSPAVSPHKMFNCRKSPGFKSGPRQLLSPNSVSTCSSPETKRTSKKLRLSVSPERSDISETDYSSDSRTITPESGNTGLLSPSSRDGKKTGTRQSSPVSSILSPPAGVNIEGKNAELPPLANKPEIRVELVIDQPEQKQATFGSEKKSSRRRNRREESPETGYREKYASSKTDRGGQHFSVYNAKGEDGRSHSTPSSGTTTPRYDYHDDTGYSKRMLNPIGASESAVSWDDPSGAAESAPIPTKPINMASRSTSSKKKVPPITARQDSYDYIESPRDSIFDEDEGRDDMPDPSAMHKIRNSATKKKVNKIFNEMATREQDDVDSGIYSKQTSRDESEYSQEPTYSNKKNADNPFGKKPKRVARSMSGQSPKSETPPSSGSSEVDHPHFQPIGGVSFRENKNSDVAIVGKGYSDDNVKSPYSQAQKPRDRRKPTNKAMLSPLGMANMYGYGQAEEDDDQLAGLVGKGMFEGSAGSSDHHNQGPGQLIRPDRRPSQTDGPNPNDFPRGVYGVSVKKDSFDEEEDENAANISMSRSTREQIQKKMQAKKEEEAKKREEEAKHREEERLEREMKEREAERQRQERIREEKERQQEKIREEKERQQEKLRRLSGTTDQGLDSALTISAQTNSTPPQPAARKRPPPKRANSKPAEESPPTSHKSVESEDETKPFKDPYRALDDSLKTIQKEDWETKMSAITNIRRLTNNHPDVLLGQLHTVNIAILNEVKNLRSQVSRLAIVCLGEMYLHLKKAMDTDLDQSTKTLLAKAGESNGFIREDADKALQTMVDNTTANRAVVALIAGGAEHRNTAIRKVAAHFLSVLVERMGPGRVLSGVKDVTDKILPKAAQFLTDSSPDARYAGSRIMYFLMSHEDFDRQMTKHVPANTLRSIQDKLENLRKKGLGDPPSSNASATRRSGAPRSGSQTRHNSAADSKNNSASSSKRRSAAPRTDDATLEEIKVMSATMSANDWRERQKGIQRLQEMCTSSPNIVNNNIVKIFDHYIPTLKDSNAKVNLLSLHVLCQITPCIKHNISNLVTLIMQNVAGNLSSKNKEIYEAATEVLDSFMEHIDATQLLQPLCSIAQTANSRIKPDMIERVSYLTPQVYPQKPKQVKMFALPLLWHMISTANGSGATQGGSGSTRQATSNLVQSLYSQMGNGLMEQAAATSTVTPRMQQQLQDLIDNP